MELFSSVGIKTSIEIPKGIEILLFQGKKSSGDGFGVQFLNI